MQQQLERERVALLPQGKARLRLRPNVPRLDVGGPSATRRQCGGRYGVPPRTHSRAIRWGDGAGVGKVGGAGAGVGDGDRKGGCHCRRWCFRDADLGLAGGFKQLGAPVSVSSVSVIQRLVLRQDGRQILQEGRDVFRNWRVRRGGLQLFVPVRQRPMMMTPRGGARPWLGELLEKVVQPRELCGFFVGRGARRGGGVGVGGQGVHDITRGGW